MTTTLQAAQLPGRLREVKETRPVNLQGERAYPASGDTYAAAMGVALLTVATGTEREPAAQRDVLLPALSQTRIPCGPRISRPGKSPVGLPCIDTGTPLTIVAT